MKTFIAALFICCIVVPSYAADVFLSLTRGDIPASDAPTNTEIITSQDFEKTGALTVADAVENTPGLIIQKTGSQGSLITPSIQGFSASQVLVVIDDVPQIPDYTGNVDLSRILLDNVDRIEIVRGGDSAVYGPNAEGGVIHIITKHPVTAVDVQATSEAGSYGTYNNSLSVGTNQGPVQAQVSGSRQLSNGFQQNSADENTSLNGLFAYNAGAYGKLSYNIDGSHGMVGVPSGTPVPIGDWNGTLERQANDLTAGQTETDRNNRVQYNNQIGGANLTSRIANDIKDLDVFEFGADTQIRTEGRNAFEKLEIPGQGALGYEFYENRLDSNVYGTYRTDAWGTFYEAYFIHTDWLKLTPGIRYDRDNTYGESWSPRIQLVIKPNEMWKLSASADRSFQAPTLADQFNPFVPPQFQPTHLDPEITWSYNLGAAVKPLPALEANVNLYHTDTRDRIALNPNQDFAAYNLNRAYTQGVEAGLAYTWKILHQKLDYTYLQAEGQDNQAGISDYVQLAFSPKHKIDYTADVSLPWRSVVSLNLVYVSKQFTDIGEVGVELPDYLVGNLRLSKKIGWAELFVACNNVLDRHYAETADIFNGFFPQPGRNYMGGMTVRFLK